MSSNEVLFVGSFQPFAGRSRQVSESLGERLPSAWTPRFCSTRRSAAMRTLHQLFEGAVGRSPVTLVNLFGSRSFWAAAAVIHLVSWRGRTCIVHLHGGSLPRLIRRHPRAARMVLRRPTAVVAPSSYLARAVRSIRPDVRIIPNAVDLEAYGPLDRSRRATNPKIVWLRTFDRLYNPRMAVRAFAAISQQLRSASLTMVGTPLDPAEVWALSELVRELGLTDSVELIQGVPKHRVPEVLRDADLFLNTSTTDNTPVTVIEAMATGLPIVSTDVGGIPDLLEHDRTALLVPSDDDAAMAAAAVALLHDDDRRHRLADSARQTASLYTWETVLPQWIDLFERLHSSEAGAEQTTGAAA